MGLGLEAEVAWRFNQLKRRGLASYVSVACGAFRACAPELCTVTDGHHREELKIALLGVATSDQWGNEARIAPGALVDDGRLDLVAVAPRGLLGAGGLAVRLFTGGVLRASGVRHWQGKRFRIERARPGLIHTDGETHTLSAMIEIAVVPASLRVLVPSAQASRGAGAHSFALQI
jgi:diacylglycerol kinase family enzyme